MVAVAPQHQPAMAISLRCSSKPHTGGTESFQPRYVGVESEEGFLSFLSLIDDALKMNEAADYKRGPSAGKRELLGTQRLQC